MGEITPILERLGAVGGGGAGAAALGLICLIQYVLHVCHGRRSRRQNRLIKWELELVVDRLSCMESDRLLAELESRVLHELTDAATVEEAAETLLDHCIPDAETGFGMFVELAPGESPCIRVARGLSPETRRRLVVDADWIDRLSHQRLLRLTNRETRRSSVFKRLSPDEKEVVSNLFVFRVGSASHPSGMLIASALKPEGAALEARIELMVRLLDTMTNVLHRTKALQQQQNELRLTREILELRRLVDTHIGTPLELLDEFLGRVVQTVEFDRAALYLCNGTELDSRPLVCVGSRLPRSIVDLWKKDEASLARKGLRTTDRFCLGTGDLRSLRARSNMTSAFVAPLVHDDSHIGVICLTRSGDGVISGSDRELLTWSVDYLKETILRSVDRAIIEQQARRDALTQLANRGTFDREINRHVTERPREGSVCSLIMLDIDRFKQLNDRYGHQAGDEVLRNIARIIQQCAARTRSTDRPLAARYGGEEMAVLLPGVGPEGGKRIANEIVETVRQSDVLYQGVTITPTISAGVATSPQHGVTAAQLIASADAALYLAKNLGRDRCEVAEDFEEPETEPVSIPLKAV